MGLEELQKKRKNIKNNSDLTLKNMELLAKESERTAEVARNSRQLLENLDEEFESVTGLKGRDIVFLFTAVGLQLTRIVLLNELTKTERAGSMNRNETRLHDFQEKLLGKFHSEANMTEKPYYASMEHIITKTGVPYDATAGLSKESLTGLIGKGRTWDVDVSEMIPDEKLSLFKGANHRFATLGHDPVLGLLFGTGNIMTNTITCIKTPMFMGKIGIPVLTTNHVVFTAEYKDPRIATYGSTGIMLQKMMERIQEQPEAFVASLIKQMLHIGTDLYTPCGIQIPGANLILSNAQVEKLTEYISTGDLLKIGVSGKLAELINLLIGTLHTMMYDPAMVESRELHSVKTRKIIMYSNAIATGSNVLWVGGNLIFGNKMAVRQMDIGGLMVVLKRFSEDKEYIRQIKEEFVLGSFDKMIQGEKLQLEETVWEE